MTTMNVCMVVYSFYDFDTRVRRYAETLAKRGDSVDVISLRHPGHPANGVLEGVHVYRVQDRAYTETGPCSYLLRLLLFFLKSMFILSRLHIRRRYAFIHVHSVPDFLVFAAWLPKLQGAKIVLDIHDLVPELYASKFNTSLRSPMCRLLLFVERISAAFADHVIAANHIWERRLRERAGVEHRCTTVLNYPDTTLFFRRGRQRVDGRFIILYPGSLNYHQGVDILVRAFALITKSAPAAELHIYGRGEQRQALECLVREQGLAGTVFLKDWVAPDALVRIMENADLGVVAKRSDGFGNEAFSTKTLEFMVLGVPLIVAETTIDRYYFNNTVVQFFRGQDERALAECMLRLINDPAGRERLAERASQYVGSFTWAARKDEYLGLVDRLTRHAHGDSGCIRGAGRDTARGCEPLGG